MRKETKLVKGILKKFFPNKRFSIRFIQARQYYDTSDKIRITVDAEDFNQICSILSSHTKGIRISEVGKTTSISGICEPKIYNFETQSFEDADMVEFIELEKKKE